MHRIPWDFKPLLCLKDNVSVLYCMNSQILDCYCTVNIFRYIDTCIYIYNIFI